MLVAALAVLSGFAVAGVLGPWTAGALLLLFALAVAFLQPAETRSFLPGGVLLAPASGMAPAAPPAEQSAAFEAFADALPDPCFILDRRGVVRYANQRANAAFAIRAGEALTFRIRVPDLVQAFDVVAKGGPPQRVEFTERVPNERWLAAWIARLGASDAVLLASGTAALEAMLCKRPMVVGHRIAPLTYRIVRLFGMLKSAHVSLPNVLAGETLIPELLQDDCTPENLHAALLRWFRDADAVAALQPRFLAIHQVLRRDASARAAEAVAQLLQSQ